MQQLKYSFVKYIFDTITVSSVTLVNTTAQYNISEQYRYRLIRLIYFMFLFMDIPCYSFMPFSRLIYSIPNIIYE